MTTQLTAAGAAAEPRRPARGRFRRLVLGQPSDPRWARPALWAVLILAAVLYSWDLSRNGDANAFYAAAVLSGTQSWKAFFASDTRLRTRIRRRERRPGRVGHVVGGAELHRGTRVRL